MCKKCKECGKSNLGAIVTHIETIAVRLLDGVVTEQFPDSATDDQTMEINYCFECNKPITEADLVEEVECPICGKMVGSLTESGACQECTDEANRLSNMSKEELILMLMKQGMAGNKKEDAAVTTIKETVTEKVEVEIVGQSEEGSLQYQDVSAEDAKKIEDTLKAQEAVDVNSTTAPKKHRTRKKPDAAEVTTNGVTEAKEEIHDKVEEIKEDIGELGSGKVEMEKVVDESLSAGINENQAEIPAQNVDVNNILDELDKIDLENGSGNGLPEGEIF